MRLRAAERVGRRLRGLRRRLQYARMGGSAGNWTRIVMNGAVDARIASLDPSRCTAAEISGENYAARPWKQYASLNYPDFDLCAPLQEERRFDVVICEQVIEHVVDPCAAAANLRRLCVPGGQVIVSTPFLVRIHELPEYGMYDYWRFSPRGLRLLLEHAGLEVEAVETWGNRRCIVANFEDWSVYRPWHSLRNEPNLPVQVWAFAGNPPDA